MAVNNSQNSLPSWSLHSSGEKQTINKNGIYILDYDKCHGGKKTIGSYCYKIIKSDISGLVNDDKGWEK